MRGPGNGPSEQRRYDGAPAPKKPAPAMPSKEEVENQKRKAMTENGCAFCDVNDPEELETAAPHVHSCSFHQGPMPEPIFVCSDHDPTEEWWQKTEERAAEKGVPIVVYECHITATAEVEKVPDDVPPPHRPPNGPRPNAPLRCRCDDPVERIVYPTDADSDTGGEN